MLRSLRFAALLGGLILSASALAVDIDAASYGYPLTNPFEATIATTPPDLRPELHPIEDIDQADHSLTLSPEREFILTDKCRTVHNIKHRMATQDKTAPLTLLIAATGSGFHTPPHVNPPQPTTNAAH